jgi:cytochrome P450
MQALFGRAVSLVDASLDWVVGGFGKWVGLIGAAFFDGLYFFMMRRPRLLRAIAGIARRWWPILNGPGLKLVTRADDVREVFERTEDFLLSPINQRKILSGDFIISLDPSPQYDDDKGLLRFAFPPDRVAQIRRHVTEGAEKWLPDPGGRGEIDIVPVAERVTVHLVNAFWGLETAGARSKIVAIERGEGLDEGEETMRLWLRKLAAIIGSREPAPFGVKEVGDACCAEFVRFVKDACERKAAARPQQVPGVGVVDRMVWRSPRTEQAWRTAAGLIVTGTAVVTKAFTHAFEQLVLQPEALARANTAARADPPDYGALERLLMEALRFNTVFPMIARYCPRNTTLARGTPRETEIPAGSVVAVSPTGAMFDPEAVDDPEIFSDKRGVQFNPDWESDGATGYKIGNNYDPHRFGDSNAPHYWPGVYMHFGSGAHWCPGDELALTEMSALCAVVLRRLSRPKIIGRLPELWRPLRYDGPAVRELKVEYG